MGMAAADHVGTIATALGHAQRLLARDPRLAVEQLHEILKVAPANSDARRMLAEAYRRLGDRLTVSGDTAQADRAYAEGIRAATKDPKLIGAAAALCQNNLPVAERILREHLKQHPTDVAAIRMLAETGARLGRHADAEKLLTRVLELAPSFEAARHNLAIILYRQQKMGEALAEIERLLARDPTHVQYRNLKAASLARLGEYERAIPLYRQLLTEHPGDPRLWLSMGHALRSAGDNDQSIAAYRKCIEAAPGFGEAYFSLANLKTFRFAPAEIDAMQRALMRTNLSEEDRYHLHFALGKAFEDQGDADFAFTHYEKGNALRRKRVNYDGDEIHALTERSRALYTPAFFAARHGTGSQAADPIFIVGLPRSGSTLIEQILSSHSQVEGTMELPDISYLARRVSESQSKEGRGKYPETLTGLSGAELRALGEEYLERTRIHRKSGRAFFIDKMPNNFAHAGFIHLILPHAKIIDARRHPMASCFSAFKQHFARGQTFSYSLEDLGRYYTDYANLMTHFDEVLPGRIHRVYYERMVRDTEQEIRRLLAYCGLDFEPACLSFHDNARAVRTASSEQVRRPIYKDAVEQWKLFEHHLTPLRRVLGRAVEDYAGLET